MYTLGISAFYHDSAAVLLQDGVVIYALQEERFTRKKHDDSFPKNCINHILSKLDLDLSAIDAVVFYDKPILKFDRLLETYISIVPTGFDLFRKAMPVWLREKLFLKKIIITELKRLGEIDPNRIKFCEHHVSHAASAFYPSPFKKAIILTVDGVGEWVTTSVAIGDNGKVDIKEEIKFPHSLGLLYSAFTFYCGFKVNSGEYKLMGLAPYGTPKYADLILEKIIDVKQDGSFWMDQKYFSYLGGLRMISKKFEELFGHKTRQPEADDLTQFHMDIASSIQHVTETVMLRIAKHLHEKYKIDNLCMAGGVALNCVANGKLIRSKTFKEIWIQPAAGDAGGALGAALAYFYMEKQNKREILHPDSMKGALLGTEFSDDEIEDELKLWGAVYEKLNSRELCAKTVDLIDAGFAIGCFQGRMEFGPRALGSRSIIADARNATMQKDLNMKVKFRESFRPFAPVILKKFMTEWFEDDIQSPYMLFVSSVLNKRRTSNADFGTTLFGVDKLNQTRSVIPAVTHVDYSARIQTVDENSNVFLFQLLNKFHEKTGTPVLVNTSFNVRGEPIVNTPSDAFKCFMGTNLDALVIGSFMLLKTSQVAKYESYLDEFELD